MFYDIRYYDKKIIKWKRNNQSIIKILDKIIPNTPLDELIILKRIIRLCNADNIKLQEHQITTAFNKYYKKSEHCCNGYKKQDYYNFIKSDL